MCIRDRCRTDHQRLTARCRAFEGRLKLLESWAESSCDVNSRKHILSIGEKVKRVLADSETCPVAENEVSPHESAPPGGSRSDAGPLIQFEDKAAPLGSTVPGLERNPFVSEANTYPSRLPTSCCYSKLPHPAEKIVRGLPKADGFCVETLLEFFKIAMRLKRCFPVSEAGFLALLMRCV